MSKTPESGSVEEVQESAAQVKSFTDVFGDELECVEQRWQTAYPDEHKGDRKIESKEPTVENKLVGLAFSGGGIRSATINMGIAQALHRRGVFDHVDYMSTVSGGGYLGSSVSTAMREYVPAVEGKPAVGEFPYEYQELDAKGDDAAAGEPREVETKFLTWVRNNSNYMATGGFLDWPRIFGVLLRGILANFLVLLPFLLILAVGMVWRHGDRLARWEQEDQKIAIASQQADKAAVKADQMLALGTASWSEAESALQDAEVAAKKTEKLEKKTAEGRAATKIFVWVMVFAGVFLLLVFIFPVLIRVFKAYQHKHLGETGEESSVADRGKVEMAFGIVLVVIFVVAALEALPLLIRWFHKMETSGLRGIVAGTGSGGALAVFTVAGKLLSNLGGLKQKIVLLLVGLLGLFIPLAVALYVVDDMVYPVAGIEAAEGSALETELAKRPAPKPELDSEGQAIPIPPTPAYLVKNWGHEPLRFGATPTLDDVVRLLPGVLLLILGGGLGAAAAGKLKPGGLRKFFACVGIVVGAFVGYCILIGSSALLAWICGEFGFAGAIRPDILVLAMTVVVVVYCWAAVDVNLTGMLGLYRDRLASAYLIGLRKKKDDDGKPTSEDEIFVEPDLNLEDLCGGSDPETCKPSKAPYHIVNTALNLQGSDDPMLRDRGSDFFMFSKLYYGGHRTGYCETGLLEKVFPQMDLPTAMAISAAAASPNAGRATSGPLVALMTLLNVRLGYWVPHPRRLYQWLSTRNITHPKVIDRWKWRIPPWALLLEMRSKVSEKGKWVNLSDGGHMENLAVYELLRRRCKYIICGDGEADPTLTFGGLAILMRSARIDMGIEIEILLDDLRLGKDDKSGQHAALGRISYPPLKKGGESEQGWLLYIKSSFTGDEDETMQEYRAKSPDFPHESTADQFFDEGQFESYRALGFHMADGLFPPVEEGECAPKLDWGEFKRWFKKLKADLAPRLSAGHKELRDQLRQISELLQKEGFRSYFYELYPDLDLRDQEETAADAESDKKVAMPEITHLVGLQLDLMESAFLSLNLDKPVNWNHPGNAGWRQLFESWSRAPSFRLVYQFLGQGHSGRFQNFCHRTLELDPVWQELAAELDDEE
jgi:hypothetical protein